MRKKVFLLFSVLIFIANLLPAVAFARGPAEAGPNRDNQNNNVENSGERSGIGQFLAEKSFEFRKNRLVANLDKIIRHLERWRERVRTMDSLGEEIRNQALAKIDEEIAWYRAERETALQTTNLGELEQIRNRVQSRWQSGKGAVKRFVGLVLASRVERLISKAKDLLGKVESLVSSAKSSGKDTAKAESLLSEARAKLDLASEKAAAGEAKFLSIKDASESQDLFKEGHNLLKEAHTALREFKQKLAEVRKELKGLGV